MKNLIILSTLLLGLNLSVINAAAPPKKKIVRNLQTKNGNKIRTKNGQIVRIKQSGFHKSLG